MVSRGPIADTATLNGRVAGLEEIGLELPTGGRVQTIAVKPGQQIAGRFEPFDLH